MVKIATRSSLRNFYKNKKVLITGHTGFKGSWLCQILLGFGCKVYGYALKPPTNPSLFDVLKLKKEIDHVVGDIRDFEKFNRLVKRVKPDIIFHLAAQPIVRASYDNPRYTYDTNVMGTVNVLESIRLNYVKVGVIITTDKVYRNFEKDIAYSEDHQLGGHDPYSNSKACADLVVESYIKSFFDKERYNKDHFSKIASARSGNIIGGGDWAQDRLIPDVVKALIVNDEELVIRSPRAIRPWQHVLEPLAGYLLLAEHLYDEKSGIKKIGPYNFGPDDEDMLSVQNVVEMMIEHINKGKYIIKEDKTKHEATLLKLDNSKAKKKLGWKSKYNIREAVLNTIEWYQEYYSGQSDIKKLTQNQIKKYFKERPHGKRN